MRKCKRFISRPPRIFPLIVGGPVGMRLHLAGQTAISMLIYHVNVPYILIYSTLIIVLT